jgi:Zn-finger nucleic acid-binding protein
MTAVENRGVTVDWCPFCQTIWFDHHELERSLRNGLAPDPDGQAFEQSIPKRGESGISCPRCHQRLHSVGWEGLAFDRCPGCRGICVDRAQLDALRPHLHGPTPPTSGQIAAVLGSATEGVERLAEILWLTARTLAGLPPLP